MRFVEIFRADRQRRQFRERGWRAQTALLDVLDLVVGYEVLRDAADGERERLIMGSVHCLYWRALADGPMNALSAVSQCGQRSARSAFHLEGGPRERFHGELLPPTVIALSLRFAQKHGFMVRCIGRNEHT